MRSMPALLFLATLACSDATGPSNSTGVVIEVASGSAYTGHTWAATVRNTGTASATVRALDCGTQIERQDGGSWTSYAPTGTICSTVAIQAGGSQVFAVNIPSNAPVGTYRVVSAVTTSTGETPIYSGSFQVIVTPICETTPPPQGVICTPR